MLSICRGPPPAKLEIKPMNRREFLTVAGCAVARAASSRSNILFLMADQFRADALGANGNTWVRTPALDRLAGAGVRFSNAYTPQALCTPARGSLMTGVYPHTTRLDGNLYKVDDAFQAPQFHLTPNLPTLLRQAGYRTGYIGKWHLGEKNPGLFDYWNGYNSYDALNPEYPLQPHWMGKPYESAYRADVDTDDAVRFLEENRARPFALFVSYYPPHNPYNPPRKFEEMYQGREHAGYYGAVTAVDLDIGRVLDKLAALKLEDNTFVSFTADHGETFGQRLGSQAKTVCYEESAQGAAADALARPSSRRRVSGRRHHPRSDADHSRGGRCGCAGALPGTQPDRRTCAPDASAGASRSSWKTSRRIRSTASPPSSAPSAPRVGS